MASHRKQKQDYMCKDINKLDERDVGSEVTEGIIWIDEGEVHAHVDRLVRNTAEDVLNSTLDAES